MIDFLEVRIPQSTSPALEFRPMFDAMRRGSFPDLKREDHYAGMADMRPYGFDAVVHFSQEKTGDHKVTLEAVGRKGFRELQNDCERLFAVNPEQLEVMRVDLAADVEQVPVYWFRDNVRFQYKRFSARIGKAPADLDYLEIGGAMVETIYAGKRPNCIRVYDKGAEWKHKHAQLRQRARRLATMPLRDDSRADAALIVPRLTFSEWSAQHGFDIDEYSRFCEAARVAHRELSEKLARARIGAATLPPLPVPSYSDWVRETYGRDVREDTVLTRVEREIAGGRVPSEISTLKKFATLPEFNPYNRLEVFNAGTDTDGLPDLPAVKGSIRQWLQIYGYRCLVLKLGGAQYASRFITQHARGHGGEILRQVGLFDSTIPLITQKGVFEQYRESVQKQLAA